MTAAQLITEYKFTDRGSVQASVATGVVRGLSRASDEAAGKGGVLSSVWNSVGSGMSRITGIITNLAASVARLGLQAALIGGAAIAGGIAAFGVAAFNAAADMDSLRRGLIAVTGSAEEADRQLIRLREVARLPGLGFQEAIQGSINLQAAGLSAGLAERALMAFGNALATVGKGREELFGVLIALTQISAKGRVSAEEILQLQERLPQIRQAMKGAFGTADTERLAKMGVTSEVFIAKIVEQFEKLPRASGGMRNAIENLTDSWTIFKAAAGEALGKVVVPLVDRLASALDTLVSSGAIQRIVEGFTRMLDFETLGHKMIVGLTWMLATIKEIPGILQTVGGYLGQWFQFIGKNLGLIQAMLLLAFGTTIVRAVIGLATAIGAVIKAIRSATLAQMLFEAVATKGATIVASLLAAAAAYFAFQGIVAPMFQGVPTFDTDSMSKHQQNITSEQQRLAGMLGVGGSWFDVVMNQLMRTRQGASAADDAGGTLAQIARNTAETARNTKMEVDLRKMAFGGGQTGRLGVTAVEMNQIRREVRLRVDKSGFRGLQLAMLEMFEEFLAQAERAGALRR